jgi:hypothetical protein
VRPALPAPRAEEVLRGGKDDRAAQHELNGEDDGQRLDRSSRWR